VTGSPRLVVVDGSSSLYRAFFALPPLHNSKGTPTHAVLGFTTMLLKLLREEQAEAVAVAFDGPGPTVRHRQFAAYKAQRPVMPEGMAQQIPYIHRVLAALQIPLLMMPEEEADDILGTVAVRAAAEGYQVVLVSGDKDLFQVVGDQIVVRDTMKERNWGPAEVLERYGVTPRQFTDFLALMGDSIDNIPGIPGVGEKTARDLVQQFGSLEAMLARTAEVTKPKLRGALLAHAAQAQMSKQLVTIRTDLPIPWTVAGLTRRTPDMPALLALFRELEFSRLVQQFSQGQIPIAN